MRDIHKIKQRTKIPKKKFVTASKKKENAMVEYSSFLAF